MLANLRAMFGLLVDLIFLRRGPESLPASSPLLVFVVLLQVILVSVLWVIAPRTPDLWQINLLVSTAVTLLCFKLAFALVNKRERFVQTMIAMFGTAVLFAPALIPLAGAMLPFLEGAGKSAQAPAALLLLGALISIWQLCVQVRIVRIAFEWPWGMSIVLIVAEQIAGVLVSALIIGAPQTPA
jgi:hypothetical protein